MWERTLKDLIRGLRAHKHDEAKFIAGAIDEIREEVKSKDMELKTAAVLKLTYLQMLGYDMSWASFHVLEVMSSQRFHHKTIGYMAAGQSFREDTDVLMLTTNLLKKDLSSTPLEIGVTLNGLAQFVSADLSRDLSHEITVMLTHSRAAIRKRAVLLLYKMIMKQPDLLQSCFSRLRDKLEDPDPGVVGATVSVLCELVRRDPTAYLPLAPQLFHILTTSTNNWVLIKVIKLFGALSPHEPRLVRKLQPPITDIINTTPAISLLYECVRTCIIGQMFQGASGNLLAQTCVRKLAAFLEDTDQNLRYISLLALVKIVPSHPHLLAEYQSTILASVDDVDISIRMRALDLVSEMVTENNIQSIVQHLLSHLAPSGTSVGASSAAQSLHNVLDNGASTSATLDLSSRSYRIALSRRILEILQRDAYALVPDFAWLLSVLVDLAYVARAPVGAALRDALVDVCLRVSAVRPYASQLMTRVLADASSFVADPGDDSCAEVLWAAAWICGEYSVERRDAQRVLGYLTQSSVKLLPPETVAVFLQSAVKIFGHWAADLATEWNDSAHLESVRRVVDELAANIEPHAASEDVEVQERAANIGVLLAFVRADLTAYHPKEPRATAQPSVDLDPDAHGFAIDDDADDSASTIIDSLNFPRSLFLLQPLFETPAFGPVAQNAQEAIQRPSNVDLDAWIVPPPAPRKIIPENDLEPTLRKNGRNSKGKERAVDGNGEPVKRKKKRAEPVAEAPVQPPSETAEERAERDRRKAERLERMRDDPYYIFDDRPKRSHAAPEDVDSIPIVKLELSLPPVSTTPSIRAADVIVDRTGHVPQRVPTPQAVPHSPSPGPDSSSNPEPIKVVRAKKKRVPGSGNVKKKVVLDP